MAASEEFKKFCVKCNKERLPSSSNAKFDFDYCAGCKGMSTFAVAPTNVNVVNKNKNVKKIDQEKQKNDQPQNNSSKNDDNDEEKNQQIQSLKK